MSDTVFIEGLEIETVIGIYDWERRMPQRLVIDVQFELDNRIPAQSEDIRDTVNYETVCVRIAEHIRRRSWLLLETLVESVASLMRHEFAVRHVRVRVAKPCAIHNAKAVGVEIERDFRDFFEVT